MTTFRQVCQCAQADFRLAALNVFPAWCPRWAGLYFNLLFVKRPGQERRVEP